MNLEIRGIAANVLGSSIQDVGTELGPAYIHLGLVRFL